MSKKQKNTVVKHALSELEVMLPPVDVNLAGIVFEVPEIEGLEETLAYAAAEKEIRDEAYAFGNSAREFNEQYKAKKELAEVAKSLLASAKSEYDRHYKAVRGKIFEQQYGSEALTISEACDLLQGTDKHKPLIEWVSKRAKAAMEEVFPDVVITLEDAQREYDQLVADAVALFEEANKCGEKARELRQQADEMAFKAGKALS